MKRILDFLIALSTLLALFPVVIVFRQANDPLFFLVKVPLFNLLKQPLLFRKKHKLITDLVLKIHSLDKADWQEVGNRGREFFLESITY